MPAAPLAALALLLAAALSSCKPSPGGCVIEGKVKDAAYEGKTVYLCNPYTSAAYDSTLVKEGTFSFEPGEQPAGVSLLELKASRDDLFPITLPVVTEKGKVRVVLGETVLTSGTPLNDNLQDFLLAVDRFSDAAGKSGKGPEEVREDFMRLLEASILQNKENRVGVYLFKAYASRLTPECRAGILEKAGEAFKENMETE